MKPFANIAFGATCDVVVVASSETGEPIEWLKLLPMGSFAGRDGRGPYHVENLAHAEEIIATTKAHLGSVDPVIDYDHQTDFAAKDGVGGTAPASGWVVELQAREDGVWGRVNWTPKGEEHLRAKEYRYVSPVFPHDKKTGRVRALLRAGLTNKPNLELGAVASEADPEDGDFDLDKSKLAKALGLGDDATEDQIHAAITGLKTTGASLATVAQAAGLQADAPATDIVTAISAARAAGGDNETIVAMQAEINTLKASTAKREATEAVDAGIKAGKITPAARDAFISLHSSDPAAFAAIVDKAPVIVVPGAKESGEDRPAKGHLSEAEKAVCSSMGWDEAEFIKARDEDAA